MKVAIYARFSTDKQDASSIDQQVHRCREFATKQRHDVVAEYRDSAQSGRSLDRPEMQQMLRDAEKHRFDAVIVDDQSRLSRDMADAIDLVFRQFVKFDVQLLDATTGMSSESAASRLVMGTYAVINDSFLQTVKAQTHRGLAERARNGYATGGRTFGYRTETEPTPVDPEHARKVIFIDDAQAQVVRRIFDEYVNGKGQAAIARQLNSEGVPAPFDGKRTKKAIRGWATSTVRAILLNAKYIGTWTWNQRKWFSISGEKARRVRLRPEDEHVTREYPERAIVAPEVWQAAQARRGTQTKSTRGRHPSSHILSGLLRCGTCGGNMAAVGVRKKAGRRYVTYGCTVSRTKGASICGNRATVSEMQLLGFISTTLAGMAAAPGFDEAFAAGYRQAEPVDATDKAAPLRTAVEEQGKVIGRLVDALAATGGSEAVVERLKVEELALRTMKAQLAVATKAQKPQVRTSGPAEAASALLKGLAKQLQRDPVAARALMLAVLEPMTLTHREEGLTSHFEGTLSTKKIPANLEVSREVLNKCGCGDRI